jgi:Ca-activated chloride channel family protein
MATTLQHRIRPVLAVTVAAALLAGACAGGDDDDASADDTFVPDGEGEATETDEEAPPRDFGEESGTGDVEAGSGGDAEAPFAEATQEAREESEQATEAATEEPAAGEAPAEEAGTDGASFGAADDEERLSGGDQEAPAPIDAEFDDYGIRDFIDADEDGRSTFALDVDTGAYSLARQWLREGQLPPREAVRPEEFVNAFDYGYEAPGAGLGITIDGAPSPFDDDNVVVRVGVQALRVDDDERDPASLTFVIDTSGSMQQDGRLELVKESLEELVDELDGADTVSIVTFSTTPRLVLEPTSANNEAEILQAIGDLGPEGSTNLEGGLRLGYEQANATFDRERTNRVILLSDGIANVGLADPDSLAATIEDYADEGINLVTVGVGLQGYSDVLMEQLADKGNGFYAYVDTEDEAERLFEDRLTTTLQVAAVDAKIQVEFDDDVVDEYRLIGFENRGIADQDFRDDDVDAGELNAGHQVTAIYELELDDDAVAGSEIGEVNLRWQDPDSGEVIEIDEEIELAAVVDQWGQASSSLRLSVVVAAFAEILRGSPHRGTVDLDDVAVEAADLADELGDPDVAELADLIRRADDLS